MIEYLDDLISRWKSRLNTVLIEYLIFSSLAKVNTYGGAILDASQKLFDDVKVPTVYAIIKRSIEYGLIEKLAITKKAEKTRGTARQYYTLTDNGLLYLQGINSYLKEVCSPKMLTQLEVGL